MKTLKKVLKIIATVYCSLLSFASLVGSIIGPIMGMPEMLGLYIPTFVIFTGLIILMWRKKLKKKKPVVQAVNYTAQRVPSVPTPPKKTPASPPPAANPSYTYEQMMEDFQVFKDCEAMVTSTQNMDAFFSCYEVGCEKALAILKARTLGVKGAEKIAPQVQQFSESHLLYLQRFLKNSFAYEKSQIEKLSAPQTKIDAWNEYLESLEEYLEDLEVKGSAVTELKQSVQEEINRINRA